jgi:RimJ/RimL family protein N-acetyltransferase
VPDLATPRLLLHPLSAEEARALRAEEPLAGWELAPGYPLPDTHDGLGLYLRHLVERFGFYLVVRAEDGLVIGEIGFVAPPADGVATIGYGIVPSVRRQGFATEAIQGMSDWALEQPGVVEVRAETTPDNEPSARALLRAGFAEVEAGERVRRFVRLVTPG